MRRCFGASLVSFYPLYIQEKFLSNAEEAMKEALDLVEARGTSGSRESDNMDMEVVDSTSAASNQENGAKRRHSDGTPNEVSK